MAIAVFMSNVTRYTAELFDGPMDLPTSARAVLQLFDGDSLVAELKFREQSQPLSEPDFTGTATAFYPFSAYAGVLAMLAHAEDVVVRQNLSPSPFEGEEHTPAITLISKGNVKTQDSV